MNEKGISNQKLTDLLDTAKSNDVGYERVLSAMCTYPHDVAVQAHTKFIEANMGDPGLFPGTYSLEKEVINMMGHLLHCSSVHGYITTGGTESNIQALRTMVNSSNVANPNVIVPESAHFSFDKIANILGIEVKKAELDSKFKVDIGSVKSLIDSNTIGLVGIAGSTEFGQIDPINSLSDIALENNFYLHVDAAFGGFVIPFLETSYHFDFVLDGVTSIALDPHKMGFSTIPSGGILFRDREALNYLQTHTPYLTISTQSSLTGTRSGASVAATYAVMSYLGKEGYRQIVEQCMDLTNDLVEGAKKIGINPLIEPVMNVVTLDVHDPDTLRARLRDEFGWYVSITRNPRALRLVLMPHLTHKNLDLFLQDLEKLVKTG